MQLAFLALVCLGADQATLPNGARIAGKLTEVNSQIVFTTSHKSFPLEQLHRVRFEDLAGDCPRGTLRHRLLLGDDDSLGGELLEHDDHSVRFRTCSGAILKVARTQLRGIAQPAGWRVIHWEDCEGELPPWQGAVPSNVAFAGKKGLAIIRPTRWTPPQPGWRGRVCFFLHRAEKAPQLQIEANLHVKSLHIECTAQPGWHLVQIDIAAESCRLCLDDVVLTEVAAREGKLVRLDCQPKGNEAGWVIDELSCLTPTPLVSLPNPLAGVETVCLHNGDELFGKILQADARSVTMRAKFGQRTFPWPDLRGIVLHEVKKSTAANHVLTVAPAPGFSADQLSGNLVSLTADRVVFQHEVLGQLTFARSACRGLVILPAKN